MPVRHELGTLPLVTGQTNLPIPVSPANPFDPFGRVDFEHMFVLGGSPRSLPQPFTERSGATAPPSSRSRETADVKSLASRFGPRRNRSLHVRRLDLLRYRDLRLLLIGQTTSQVADAVATVVLVTNLLFAFENGPTVNRLVGLVVTMGVPLVIAGPLGGIAADRLSRRAVLVVGQALRAGTILGAAVAVVEDNTVIALVFWGAALCIARILYTARVASIRHLVRRHELVAADSLSLTLGPVAGVVGASAALGLAGVPPVAVVSSATCLHLVSSLAYRLIAINVGGGRLHDRTTWTEVVSHLRAPKVRFAMMATSSLRLLNGIVFASVLLVGHAASGGRPMSYAAAMGAVGVGAFIGSNTAEWVNEHIARRAVTTNSYAVTAILSVVALVVHAQPAYVALLGIGSFVFQNLRICTDATVQSNAIRGAGGREFALYDASYNLAYLGGILIGLVVKSILDVRLTLGLVAIVLSGFVVVFAVLPRSAKDFEHAVARSEGNRVGTGQGNRWASHSAT